MSEADLFAAYGGFAGPPPPLNPFLKYGGRVLRTAVAGEIQFHEKLAPLFVPARYKVLEGGRGSMKSWGVARALLIIALQSKKRILCAREYQTSISESVHKTLADMIVLMGLSPWYRVQKNRITASNGSEFIFIGLGDLGISSNRTKIKSYEGVDICWIEEAEGIADTTWEVLIPTIRKSGSEIWIVYNPNLATDATYQRFHEHPQKDQVTIRMNWRDNLWLTKELMMEKDHLFSVDAESAAHVWDGELRRHAEATIFRGKYVVEYFDTPDNSVFYHGDDWGFSQDPTALVRCFITHIAKGSAIEKQYIKQYPQLEGVVHGDHLWIDWEAWKIGCEITDTPDLFDRIPTSRRWPIIADSARPELISYMARQGFRIEACEKWDGSVEDGIAHLRGFRMIHIHSVRCPHAAQEFRDYRFKVDKNSGMITPLIVDANNHIPDAIRYGLGKFIKRRGVNAQWAALGR